MKASLSLLIIFATLLVFESVLVSRVQGFVFLPSHQWHSPTDTNNKSLRSIWECRSSSSRAFSIPHAHHRQQQQDDGNKSPIKSGFWDQLSEKREALTTQMIRHILDQLKTSDFIQEKHQEHVDANKVSHLFQNSSLAALPDRYKLDFVHSRAGRALQRIMQEEQDYLGDWKVDKIQEAARDYNAKEIQDHISLDVRSHDMVMYSFQDCPWCVAAKSLLNDHYVDKMSFNISIAIIELEPLGVTGKAIRAELAQQMGRTSMPCIFVHGKPIGGFTDGAPCGIGLQAMHQSGQLQQQLLQ